MVKDGGDWGPVDHDQDHAPAAQRFELLACALAGRAVKLAAADAGKPSWTDGTTIYVDDGAAPADWLRSLAVQSCLIAAGSLDPAIVAGLSRRPALARRYLAIEGGRALRASAEVLPPPLTHLIGLGVDSPSACPAQSLTMARAHGPVDEPPACFGVIRARKVLAASRSADRTAEGAHRMTRTHESDLADLDDDVDSAGIDDPFSSPVGGGGPLGRLLQKLLGARRQEGGRGPLGADSPTHRMRNGNRRNAGVFSTAAKLGSDDGVPAVGALTYPEWDFTQRRYRPAWCTVTEVEPRVRDGDLIVGDRHGLRRPLTRLGIALDRCHRQAQGDDVDIDAVVQTRVELRAGCTPDERLYIDSRLRRRDLSVLVLLDVSGSAGEPGAFGQIVHAHQRLAATTLLMALHELGDRVAMYAFASQGRSAVHLLPVKRFDENLDAACMQRINGLVPGAYSRLGAAIRHGTALVREKGATSHRLLVVVSDGLAYDHGYERAYGAADARWALSEARRQGIGCLCLTVGADTDNDELARVFGSAAHATVPKPAQVADVIGPLFRAALRSADIRRRVS